MSSANHTDERRFHLSRDDSGGIPCTVERGKHEEIWMVGVVGVVKAENDSGYEQL